MESSNLPSWDDLRRDYIEPGLPHRLVISAAPGIHAFTDSSAARLGARFELASEAPAAPDSMLEQIVVSDVIADERRWLEVSTTVPRLYESFYHLIGQIADAVLAGAAPHSALAKAVELWDALVEQTSVLSEERQTGLFGELTFLERLIQSGATDTVSAWVGPNHEAHDFRLGKCEFEVKTTSGAKRIHTINGLGQLKPSVDCNLYLVSIQTTDAGAGGITLPELVDTLREKVSHSQRKDFEARLEVSGFIERHRPHYIRRRRLRSRMILVPVVDGTPRLTPDALSALPNVFAASRIGSVVYDIDIAGLGFVDGSPEFLAVIPHNESAAA